MSVNLTKQSTVLLFLLLLILAGAQAQTTSEAQRRIASEALKLVGRPNLVLDSKTFPWDCSGTVLAALYNAGLDVTREYGSYSGNGVNRLNLIGARHQLDYDLPLPELGDIIFWDNTYDKNEDLLWNDELTHTGIVVGVTSDGTISYVHHDYRRGIVVAYMNLCYPQSRYGVLPDGTKVEINSPLRMSSQRYLDPDKWLASHLFRGFARMHLLLAPVMAQLSTGAPAGSGSKQ